MTQGRNPSPGQRPGDDDDWGEDGDWDEIPRARRRRSEAEDDYAEYTRRDSRQPKKKSDRTAGLILAILGWFLCPFCSPVAVVLAILEINAAKQAGDPAPGVSIAALIIAGINLLLLVGYIAVVILINL